MSHNIKSCPFCGNDNNDIVCTPENSLWMCQVHCGHCNACGTTMGDPDRDISIESAIDYWNNAGRPTWWDRNVIKRWTQFQYDARNLYDTVFQRMEGNNADPSSVI